MKWSGMRPEWTGKLELQNVEFYKSLIKFLNRTILQAKNGVWKVGHNWLPPKKWRNSKKVEGGQEKSNNWHQNIFWSIEINLLDFMIPNFFHNKELRFDGNWLNTEKTRKNERRERNLDRGMVIEMEKVKIKRCW